MARIAPSITDLIAEYRAACEAFSAAYAETIADEESSPYKAAQDRLSAAVHALRAARLNRRHEGPLRPPPFLIPG